MNEKTKKRIGIGLMVPALVLVVYLIISAKFWIIAGAFVGTSILAMVGYHMFKGNTLKEAVQETVEDIEKK